jgi:hypothetical protein
MNGQSVANLASAIHAGRCVAFVGAGFSAAAPLPAWGQLLEEVSRRGNATAPIDAHVLACIRRGSSHALDEAAQILEDAISRDRFVTLLEEILGRPEHSPVLEQRLRWLRGIPFRTILTTNFDGVLKGFTPGADVYREALLPARFRWWEERFWDDAQGAVTVKLHGDLSADSPSLESLVFTRRDYRRLLYTDPGYTTFLRALLSTHTVLYLGFSFEDAYLNELRSEVLALIGQRAQSQPVAYAIINDVPSATQEHFRRNEGIEILTYDSHSGRDFSGFDRHLEALYLETSPFVRLGRHLQRRRVLWVDPHPENNELAFRVLAAAAREAGGLGHSLVLAHDAEGGLRQLRDAARGDAFDLVLTHWGEGAAPDDTGSPSPTAVRLLTRMRAEDLRTPLLVFAAEDGVTARKPIALSLGAQGYCFSFSGLIRTIESIFSSDEETGSDRV